jgi:hypothetical protein
MHLPCVADVARWEDVLVAAMPEDLPTKVGTTPNSKDHIMVLKSDTTMPLPAEEVTKMVTECTRAVPEENTYMKSTSSREAEVVQLGAVVGETTKWEAVMHLWVTSINPGLLATVRVATPEVVKWTHTNTSNNTSSNTPKESKGWEAVAVS